MLRNKAIRGRINPVLNLLISIILFSFKLVIFLNLMLVRVVRFLFGSCHSANLRVEFRLRVKCTIFRMVRCYKRTVTLYFALLSVVGRMSVWTLETWILINSQLMRMLSHTLIDRSVSKVFSCTAWSSINWAIDGLTFGSVSGHGLTYFFIHVHLEPWVDIFYIVYLFQELLNELQILLSHLILLTETTISFFFRLIVKTDS